MPQRKSTRSKNARKRRRQHRNEFWLAISTHKGQTTPVMYCRKPNREEIYEPYKKYYKFDWRWWVSLHADHYPNTNSGLLERFEEINDFDAIRVKLIIYSGNEPDFYIQRVGENLFISSFLYSYCIVGDESNKVAEVPHDERLSNKLFPDVTDESGIVGVRIVRF